METYVKLDSNEDFSSSSRSKDSLRLLRSLKSGGLRRQFSGRAVSSAGSNRSIRSANEEVMEGEWRRGSGLGWPWHPLQAAAWGVVGLVGLGQTGLLAPSFASVPVQVALHVLMSALLLLVAGLKVALTAMDPADPAVLRSAAKPFDRSRHARVIDHDFFCHICQDVVHPSSKHCRQCNKCVLDFDHHCKWLNNCVGARNYKWFLVFVGAVVVATACLALECLGLLLCYCLQRESLKEPLPLLAPKPWLVLVSLFLALAVIITGLTAHLLAFHVSLINRGLTTYNFIMDKREAEAAGGPKEAKGRWCCRGRRRGSGGQGAKVRSLSAANGAPAAASAVPRLPPIPGASPKTSSPAQARLPAVSASVPFRGPAGPAQPVARPAESTVELREAVVRLPPLRTGQGTRSSTLFTPDFESVFGEEREMALPSILVTQSDSDTGLGDSFASAKRLPVGLASTAPAPLSFSEARRAVPETGSRLPRYEANGQGRPAKPPMASLSPSSQPRLNSFGKPLGIVVPGRIYRKPLASFTDVAF